MIKLIVNGLMRAEQKFFKVCQPGTSPVIKEACMLVHEKSGVFIRKLGGTAEITVFVLYKAKTFFILKNY